MDNRMPLQRQTPVFQGDVPEISAEPSITRAPVTPSGGDYPHSDCLSVVRGTDTLQYETVSYQFLCIPLTVPHKLPVALLLWSVGK